MPFSPSSCMLGVLHLAGYRHGADNLHPNWAPTMALKHDAVGFTRERLNEFVKGANGIVAVPGPEYCIPFVQQVLNQSP